MILPQISPQFTVVHIRHAVSENYSGADTIRVPFMYKIIEVEGENIYYSRLDTRHL